MSNKSSVRTRIFALIGALLFFITSFGFTGLVLWQMHKDSEAKKINEGAQQALQQQQAQQQTSDQQPQEGQLQGTKLQNYTPVSNISELKAVDIKEGTGEEVKAGDTITAHYTGAVASDGTIFQSSKDTGQPATFSLNQVIQGWQQGVPGMKVGGTRRLLIPASLAYGANPPQGSGIPANADLVFDIELISIGQ